MRMYGRTSFLLIILVLVPKSQQEQNQLAPVINDLSIVARLINGISLQVDFMRSSPNLNAVVGELLGIGDSNAIPELLKVNVKDLMKDVDGILTDVKSLPASSSQDSEAVGDAINFLKSINLEKVKTVVQMDRSALESKWNTAADVKFDTLKSDDMVTGVETLKFLLENKMNDNFEVQNAFLVKLRKFASTTDQIASVFRIITGTSFDCLWEILSTKSLISDIPDISKVAKEYVEKTSSISSLSQSLTDMKTAIDGLKPIIKKSQASSATKQILEAMSMFSTDKTADKNLTIGLPNGIGDLKLIFEDLNGKWLKENVAKGKDMKMLVTALQPLQKFYENLKPVETSWSKLRKDPETGKNIGSIASILKNSKILNPDDLIAKLDPASTCVAALTSTTFNQMFDDFDLFYNGLDKFDGELKKLQSVLGKVKQSPVIDTIKGFNKNSFLVKQDPLTTEEIAKELNTLLQYKQIRDISKLMSEYLEGLKTIDFGLITSMLSSRSAGFDIQKKLADSGLLDAIECLNREKFDYTGAEALSRFKQSVEVVKTQGNAQGSMKLFSDAVEALISADKKLKESVNGMGVGRRRRRRSRQGSEAKGLLKLTDSGKVARELGNAVQVLREMSEVFENQDKVMKVARSDAAVDTVIQSIPEMNGKWTVENKKALEKLVDEVNKLNGNVDKDQSLKGIWKQFGEAQSVNGAPIEGRILGTLVFGVLEKNSDPIVKTASGDFKGFPPLQLDFTGSKRIYLRDASMILVPITSFFKDFFAIDTNSNTSPSSDSPNYLLYAGVGAGCLALLTAIGVGGYFGFRSHSNKKKWKNRERLLIYIAFHSSDEELFLNDYVSNQQAARAKEMVKAGAYIGRFTFSNVGGYATALHMAVIVNDPDLVEFLIKNGADKTAVSSRNETPDELLLRLMKEEKDGGKNHLKMSDQGKIKTILKKYKKKTFQQKLPPLLAPSNFWILFPGKTCKEFERAHSGKVDADKFYENDKTTHCVVEVDKNGVAHFDKNASSLYFQCVFGRTILVAMEWASLCAKDSINFHKDYDYRVTKVELNGKIYTNVDKIKECARGLHIPYGAGINVLMLGEYAIESYVRILDDLGFTTETDSSTMAAKKCDSFYLPNAKNMIVYEGESVDSYAKKLKGLDLNDYNVMSLDELPVFLFEMKVTVDVKKNQKKKKVANSTSSTMNTIE